MVPVAHRAHNIVTQYVLSSRCIGFYVGPRLGVATGKVNGNYDANQGANIILFLI